jgi:hypothetical protein
VGKSGRGGNFKFQRQKPKNVRRLLIPPGARRQISEVPSGPTKAAEEFYRPLLLTWCELNNSPSGSVHFILLLTVYAFMEHLRFFNPVGLRATDRLRPNRSLSL